MRFHDTEILHRSGVSAVEGDCVTKRELRIAYASGGLVGESEVVLYLRRFWRQLGSTF
ncbi:MAG: hypothetical protein IH827_04600, partial [Myxococcales bacterium]|nr:hypothetical protein [Myxococcales bacterium]